MARAEGHVSLQVNIMGQGGMRYGQSIGGVLTLCYLCSAVQSIDEIVSTSIDRGHMIHYSYRSEIRLPSDDCGLETAEKFDRLKICMRFAASPVNRTGGRTSLFCTIGGKKV